MSRSMRITLTPLLFLVYACGGDSGSGPVNEWRIEVTGNHYDRGVAFFAVDGKVTKVEIEIEDRRLPFTVGVSQLFESHLSRNRLILLLAVAGGSDARVPEDLSYVTAPVMPTYGIVEDGVFLVDSTRELIDDAVFLIISYQ